MSVWPTGLFQKRGKKGKWTEDLSGSFLSPVSYWARANGTLLTFRLCDPAPQLKPDHEIKCIHLTFHLRLGAKEQCTMVGALTKKEKDECDQGKLKDTQSCPKEYPFIWFLSCRRWANRAARRSHSGLQKKLLPSLASHMGVLALYLCQRIWKSQHYSVTENTALTALFLSKAYKNALRSQKMYCFQNRKLINWN